MGVKAHFERDRTIFPLLSYLISLPAKKNLQSTNQMALSNDYYNDQSRVAARGEEKTAREGVGLEPVRTKRKAEQGHVIRDEAIEDSVYALRPRIFNLFMYLTNSQDLAEDLTQEAFARLWEGRSNFRGECSMMTWAGRIARHTYYDHQRRQYREREVLNESVDAVEVIASPAQALEQVTMRCAAAQALQQLSDVERQAVVLVKIEGLSYREAGEVLGEPTGTVKWRVMEALGKLKKFLTESEDFREEGDGQDVHLRKA
jgi:RNA polymerase sigma-70 factor (ECF subfamily)